MTSDGSVNVIDMDTLAKVRRAANRVAARTAHVEDATTSLAETMREAREQGASLRAIGQAAGVSHEHVRKLLREAS